MSNNTPLLDDTHFLDVNPGTQVLIPLPPPHGDVGLPAFGRMLWLRDELMSTLRVARTNRDERVVLVFEAQTLVKEIEAEIRAIEECSLTDPMWASVAVKGSRFAPKR